MLVDFHVHAFAEKIAARAIGQIAGKADLIPETDGTAEGLRRRQRHGAERILFASDCPWDSPVRIHRIMDDFALTPAQRSRIDWENALELLEQH